MRNHFQSTQLRTTTDANIWTPAMTSSLETKQAVLKDKDTVEVDKKGNSEQEKNEQVITSK